MQWIGSRNAASLLENLDFYNFIIYYFFMANKIFFMKNLLIILLISAVAGPLFSQAQKHTFHLKDGTVFEGEIIEKTKDGDYLIKTYSGNSMLILADNIKQITFDTFEVDVNDYGSQQAFGISLLGPGFVGAHFRYRAADELFFDVGGHLNSVFLIDEVREEFMVEGSPTISGGVDYFLQRFYKEKKNKVRANGLFFNAAHSFGNYDSSTFALGWSSEYFKGERYHRSFLLQLGAAVSFNYWVTDPINARYTTPDEVNQEIYLRLTWVFHQRKR